MFRFSRPSRARPSACTETAVFPGEGLPGHPGDLGDHTFGDPSLRNRRISSSFPSRRDAPSENKEVRGAEARCSPPYPIRRGAGSPHWPHPAFSCASPPATALRKLIQASPWSRANGVARFFPPTAARTCSSAAAGSCRTGRATLHDPTPKSSSIQRVEHVPDAPLAPFPCLTPRPFRSPSVLPLAVHVIRHIGLSFAELLLRFFNVVQ